MESNAAEGGKSTINGDDDTCYEFCGVAQEPKDSSNQFLRLAESCQWCVVDDFFAAFGKLAGFFIDKEEAVLLGEEEAGCDGVYTDIL